VALLKSSVTDGEEDSGREMERRTAGGRWRGGQREEVEKIE
jgi:hypothetical protein